MQFKRYSVGRDVETLLDDQRHKHIIRNREILERVIDISYVIGKQNLAFRGHLNEAAYDLNEIGLFQCNFLEIVKLVAIYDPVPFNYLQNCKQFKKKKNAKRETKKVEIWSRSEWS